MFKLYRFYFIIAFLKLFFSQSLSNKEHILGYFTNFTAFIYAILYSCIFYE